MEGENARLIFLLLFQNSHYKKIIVKHASSSYAFIFPWKLFLLTMRIMKCDENCITVRKKQTYTYTDKHIGTG